MDFTFEKMCRTCMNEERLMFSVFDKQESQEISLSYADMLSSVATVDIGEEDLLPKQICQYCLRQLIVSYTFKQTTERSYATLLEITKNPNIEFIKEEATDTLSDLEEFENISQSMASEYLSQTTLNQQTIKSETPEDFRMTAEYLNDDFQVKEEHFPEENVELSVENDDSDLDDVSSSKKNYSDEIEKDLNSLKQNSKKLSSSILKSKSQLKKKSTHKVDFNEIRNHLPMKQLTKTRAPVKEYNCNKCDKKFVKFQTYIKHKQRHALLKCTICEKEFRSSHGIRYHMYIHNDIKNFPCTFPNCNKKFRLKQALEKHLSIHNNEKNHLCPLCGKMYATYDALHYHVKHHRGERPYLCVYCGKTFKQSCHMKNHMWNHTGIKPYKCKSCGKCYTTGHQLKKHLRKYCNNPNRNKNDEQEKMEGIKYDDVNEGDEETAVSVAYIQCG